MGSTDPFGLYGSNSDGYSTAGREGAHSWDPGAGTSQPPGYAGGGNNIGTGTENVPQYKTPPAAKKAEVAKKEKQASAEGGAQGTESVKPPVVTTPPEEKAPPAPEEKQAQPEPVTPAAPPTKPAPPQNGVDPRPIVNTYEPPAKKTPQGYSGPPPGFGSPSTTNAWNWGNFFKGVKNAAIDSYVNTVANAFTLGLYGMAKSGAEAYSIARSPAETWGGITSFVQSNPEEAAGMAAYYAFEAVLAGTVVGAELASVERGLSNTIREGKQANHIFSGKMGKFMDTQANRSLITDLSNDPANFCGVDQYGKSWFAKTLPNGTQIYSYAQDGIIKGAGVNSTPVNLVGKYGLR